MKKIELDELKIIEKDILKTIDFTCEKNNIQYYAVGGTLLGAVRHGGFIPWDDDIDIAMPRAEFEKLRKVFNNVNYKIQFFDNVKDYGYPFPKIVDDRTILVDYKNGTGKEISGVFVDLFLYDGMGNSKFEAYVRFYFLRCLKRMVFLSRRNLKMESLVKTIVFFIPCIICKGIGVRKLNIFYNKMCSKKKFENSKYVACVAGRYGKKEIFAKDVFSKCL